VFLGFALAPRVRAQDS